MIAVSHTHIFAAEFEFPTRIVEVYLPQIFLRTRSGAIADNDFIGKRFRRQIHAVRTVVRAVFDITAVTTLGSLHRSARFVIVRPVGYVAVDCAIGGNVLTIAQAAVYRVGVLVEVVEILRVAFVERVCPALHRSPRRAVIKSENRFRFARRVPGEDYSQVRAVGHIGQIRSRYENFDVSDVVAIFARDYERGFDVVVIVVVIFAPILVIAVGADVDLVARGVRSAGLQRENNAEVRIVLGIVAVFDERCVTNGGENVNAVGFVLCDNFRAFSVACVVNHRSIAFVVRPIGFVAVHALRRRRSIEAVGKLCRARIVALADSRNRRFAVVSGRVGNKVRAVARVRHGVVRAARELSRAVLYGESRLDFSARMLEPVGYGK